MRAVRGSVPARAQEGLSATFVVRSLFLACQCHPVEDIEVALADDALQRFEVSVRAIETLNDEIRGIYLQPPAQFDYHAGQFVQLFRDPQTARNYSLASVPVLDSDIVLHVRRVPGGQVSGWVFESLRPGDRVTISEARGSCFYVPGSRDQDLLLIGTGCGLAPLYGIVRDALSEGHRGRIALYHGSYEASGLYLINELRELAARHSNFSYRPCLSTESDGPQYWAGTPLECALREHSDLAGWRVYLCGNPKMVEEARMQTFLAGAGSGDILADPHLPSGSAPTVIPADC